MLFKRKFIVYPVLLSSSLLLTACINDEDETNAAAACIGDAKSITTSDERTLCVKLTAFKAEAPFMAGFNAPGKTTHTVFVSDSKGNPVNIGTDKVITAISQYPMMYMTEHKHSAPYKAADTSVAEYGAYNFDVYYPMPSTMGRWEYRVILSDNNGTADDATDDKTHTITFEPDVEMIMSSKAYRAFARNANDKYKTAMGSEAVRRYSIWMESIGKVANGVAATRIYLTTEEMDHSSMAMAKVQARAEEHVHVHSDSADSGTMSDTDSHTYPAIHAPMDIMGSTMKVTLHGADGTTAVEVATVTVEASTDDGVTWTTLAAGMTHNELGYYSADVPMAAGDVTMLVKVTVNDNVMTNTGVADDGFEANAMPELKFSVTE